MEVKKVVAILAALAAIYARDALAQEIEGYPGWNLTEVTDEENVYSPIVGRFTLQPFDGRPAISVNASVAARIKVGSLSPSQAYSGKPSEDPKSALAQEDSIEPGSGAGGVANSAFEPTSRAHSNNSPSTAESSQIPPAGSAPKTPPGLYCGPVSGSGSGGAEARWGNGPASAFPFPQKSFVVGCESLCKSDYTEIDNGISSPGGNGLYTVGSKRFLAYQDFVQCARVQCDLQVMNHSWYGLGVVSNCTAAFEPFLNKLHGAGDVANYGYSSTPQKSFIPDGPVGFKTEAECKEKMGPDVWPHFCAESVRITEEERKSKATDPINSLNRSYAWDMYAGYWKFFAIHFPAVCAPDARKFCPGDRTDFSAPGLINEPVPTSMLGCLGENLASLSASCQPIVTRMLEKDKLRRQCNLMIAIAVAKKYPQEQQRLIGDAPLTNPVPEPYFLHSTDPDLVPMEEHCIWAAAENWKMTPHDAAALEPDEAKGDELNAMHAEGVRYFGFWELYLRARRK